MATNSEENTGMLREMQQLLLIMAGGATPFQQALQGADGRSRASALTTLEIAKHIAVIYKQRTQAEAPALPSSVWTVLCEFINVPVPQGPITDEAIYAGLLRQYPEKRGELEDIKSIMDRVVRNIETCLANGSSSTGALNQDIKEFFSRAEMIAIRALQLIPAEDRQTLTRHLNALQTAFAPDYTQIVRRTFA